MAKINAHGLRQVGPTFFTETVRPPAYDGDVETVYYEAYRLRSDRTVQTRIIRTWPKDPESGGRPTEHRGSAFRNLGKLSGEVADAERLRAWLTRHPRCTIVKTSY
jgi:hypothetical protein